MIHYSCVICQSKWRAFFEHKSNYTCVHIRCCGPGIRLYGGEDNMPTLQEIDRCLRERRQTLYELSSKL